MEPVLSVRNLSKTFAGTTVVQNVTFDLHPGEIMALVGENGAGKSTTKNILCGLLAPTTGDIFVGGQKVEMTGGETHGISAVHQELSLFQTLSVAENICIQRLPGGAARVDWAEADRIAQEQLDFLGIDIAPGAAVETLGAGKQQIVEIGKALLHADKVLILDEPTTSLTAVEREKLFAILDRLKARGLAIVFISHFMEEIYRVCDSYVTLRDGHQVSTGKLVDVPQAKLEEMMVGRAVGRATATLQAPQDDVALAVRDFRSEDFVDVNFDLRKGEVLGIAGLMGAGRTEIVEAIFGVRKAEGAVLVNGQDVSPTSVQKMKDLGVVYVPEDRRTNGLFLNRSIRENLSAAAILRFVTRALRGIGFRGERAQANAIVADMNISVPHLENAVGDLSGGNQQKVMLGRWLATKPDIVILDEPTKGVDIGAKFEIHATVNKLAEAGAAVLIVSSDLPELLNIAHRIIVIRKGRIAGEVARDDFDAAQIISLAASEKGA